MELFVDIHLTFVKSSSVLRVALCKKYGIMSGVEIKVLGKFNGCI